MSHYSHNENNGEIVNIAVFQILISLRQGASQASEILDAIRAMDETATGPSLASFYRHLKRGLDEGWIESVGEETGAKSPGRPSQRYRLTDSGLGAVRSEAARLRALAALALSDDVTASANVLDV